MKVSEFLKSRKCQNFYNPEGVRITQSWMIFSTTSMGQWDAVSGEAA